MGNHCSCVCNSALDGKGLEIEETKRERIKIQTDSLDFESMSNYSYSENTHSTLSNEIILKSVVRQYLNTKLLKTMKIFQTFSVSYTIINGSSPIAEEIAMLENEIPKITQVGIEENNELVFMPTVKMQDGNFYEGQWNLNSEQPEGNGIMIHCDQSKYVGTFKEGVKTGYGRMIKIDGSFYEGGFKNNIYHGQGILIKPCKNYPTAILSKKNFFNKDWENKIFRKYAEVIKSEIFYYRKNEKPYDKNKKLSNEETVEWQGYIIYSGTYFKGMKHGKGKMCFSDGSIYIGDYSNNIMEGQGVFEWVDGKKYSGQWKNSRLHGEGLYNWPDGREYKGCYANGYRDGYGIFKWPDKREYVGEWSNGYMHGLGTFTTLNKKGEKSSIKAIWEKGKKQKLIPM
ncbi:hypothetical protein SteCoe_21750 [Stentor coeruleus]|uniref:MORN repeat protein n=1 Tax=Stentor coeruleus TaxID=5963 RepID=A0A1R2BNT7_9CILI|nr:hypothetical protein SteCoe_21750 [Stentor coeruleus]